MATQMCVREREDWQIDAIPLLHSLTTITRMGVRSARKTQSWQWKKVKANKSKQGISQLSKIVPWVQWTRGCSRTEQVWPQARHPRAPPSQKDALKRVRRRSISPAGQLQTMNKAKHQRKVSASLAFKYNWRMQPRLSDILLLQVWRYVDIIAHTARKHVYLPMRQKAIYISDLIVVLESIQNTYEHVRVTGCLVRAKLLAVQHHQALVRGVDRC